MEGFLASPHSGTLPAAVRRQRSARTLLRFPGISHFTNLKFLLFLVEALVSEPLGDVLRLLLDPACVLDGRRLRGGALEAAAAPRRAGGVLLLEVPGSPWKSLQPFDHFSCRSISLNSDSLFLPLWPVPVFPH